MNDVMRRKAMAMLTALASGLALIAATTGCRPPTSKEPSRDSASPIRSTVSNQTVDQKGEKAMAITITSGAFEPGKPIPKTYTGDGEDRSPPLSWNGVPAGAKELALICDDPDAPSPRPWVHWVIYNIPGDTKSLEEGIPRKPRPPKPAGSLQGVNSFPSDNIGYRGPAPPKGHGVHHYHFKLYALDAPLGLEPGLSKHDLLNAISGHVLGHGELIGTYERPK
ncbi:MAG TPA: YbhB/YbcL family Raf kinase inhibitor-like protein [Pirellulales bacterium]|nr:YbhB/YbcL family Raf kinase inhibitor-like protein [Pirellulales bacterium]